MKLDRRQFIAYSGAGLSIFSLKAEATGLQGAGLQGAQPPATAPAQPPAGQPPAPQAPPAVAKFTDVRRNVGIFTMRGGTIGWLVNKDAAVVIDTQFADTAKACLDGLKQKSGNRTLDAVFNTHHHGDHTGGNAVFRAEAKRIIAQANVPEWQKKSAAANAPAPTVADATFVNTWSEKYGDETVAAQYNGPGHTNGDAIIFFERAHVAHMGDLLFHERHPRVDRPSGASIQNWIVVLDKAAKDFPGDTIFIAGHAREGQPVTVDRKAVQGFRNYLDAVLTTTKKAIAAGQTKEALVAMPSLPGFEHYQGAGTLSLSGVLTAAHEELSAR